MFKNKPMPQHLGEALDEFVKNRKAAEKEFLAKLREDPIFALREIIEVLQERDKLQGEKAKVTIEAMLEFERLKQSLAQPAQEPAAYVEIRSKEHNSVTFKALQDFEDGRHYLFLAQQPAQAAVPEGWKLKITNKEQIELLRNALQYIRHVIDQGPWWIDLPDRGGFDVKLIDEALAATAPSAQPVEMPRQELTPMGETKRAWFFSNDEIFIDVEYEEGRLTIYARDRVTEKDIYLEQPAPSVQEQGRVGSCALGNMLHPECCKTILTAAPSTQVQEKVNERAEFEQWAIDLGQFATYQTSGLRWNAEIGHYAMQWTELAWKAWQARAALNQNP